MKKIIVLGGGFAGINAVKELSKNKEIEIILIDRNNHHLFQPLLYQVATAGLNPGDITFPLRTLFANNPNISVIMGEVKEINLNDKNIILNNEKIYFDYLIMGLGSETNYFDHPEWKNFSYELKNVDDAIILRNRILTILEEKELKKENSLEIAIIGGGATGVELAGSIGEFLRFTTKNEFSFLNTKMSNLYIIERSDRILSQFSKESSLKATEYLKTIGVTTLNNSTILKIDDNVLALANKEINADLIIWTAGIKAVNLNLIPELYTAKNQKYLCNNDLSLPQYPNIFVTGDQSTQKNIQYPAVAPLAIQQGTHAAKNILRDLKLLKRIDFKYSDRGSLAVIGRRFAIAKIFNREFSGSFAWLIWCFFHIIPLVSFRSKLLVFFEFMWSYFHYKRGVRIITKQKRNKDLP